MKAPNKIYLRQIPGQKVEIFWYRKRGKFCDNHEYIRKDALLEWAKEKREWYEGTDFADVYQKVIDKLNSM